MTDRLRADAVQEGRRDPDRAEVHGTCVALGGAGVLLRGAPGAGKSDLALRLIDGGACLVADDRVCLTRADRSVRAAPPPALAGLIEVRGLGIVRVAPERLAASVPLALVVDLTPADAVARLPEPRTEAVLGLALPVIALDPFAASAPAKLRLAAGLAPGSIIPL